METGHDTVNPARQTERLKKMRGMPFLPTRATSTGADIALWLLIACLGVGAALLGNVHRAGANPAITHSRYVPAGSSTTDLYNRGCALGAAGENGAIILAFGQPWYTTGIGYGTNLPGSTTFIAINDIKARAQSFAQGFFNCSTSSAFASIIIGTSNYGSQVNNGHGAAWAQMVNDVQAFVTSPPSYAARVSANGGSDIELSWNGYATSQGWVQSYDSVNQRNMYDFGDAAGCPSTQSGNVTGQTGSAGGCNNGWTQDGVRYVSWGNPAAYPFPEIYSQGSPYGANAIQWQRIANYSKQVYGGSMIISGVLTQQGACDDNGGPSACPGVYNSPTQGYDQMWNALNYLDAGYVAHSPQWLSDIDWR